MKNTLLALTMLTLSTATFAQQQPPPPPQPPMEQGPGRGRFGKRGEMGPNKEKMEMFKLTFLKKLFSVVSSCR